MNNLVAPTFYEQTWDLQYKHALGETTGKFLDGLRDRKILGRRCDGCNRVLVPARSFCDRCFRPTSEWVDVATTGLIEMFTIVYEPFKGLPAPPYALVYVTLEGADTALLGYLRGLDLADQRAALERLSVGTPVVTRFVDSPEATVRDYWFELKDGK